MEALNLTEALTKEKTAEESEAQVDSALIRIVLILLAMEGLQSVPRGTMLSRIFDLYPQVASKAEHMDSAIAFIWKDQDP